MNDENEPTPGMRLLTEQDVGELRKELANGIIKPVDAEALGLEDFEAGPYNYRAEQKRLEELNDKLYGELPEYQAEKAAKKKKAADKAAAQAAADHAHHHEDPHACENYLA